jgi:hypothetical protein
MNALQRKMAELEKRARPLMLPAVNIFTLTETGSYTDKDGTEYTPDLLRTHLAGGASACLNIIIGDDDCTTKESLCTTPGKSIVFLDRDDAKL